MSTSVFESSKNFDSLRWNGRWYGGVLWKPMRYI